ncbi:uncharacterized protein LOC131288828 [Anopheles ziemanni]|uniref:uncharacterized protein LOC131261323 n=1 Tax=Anopheles coustani TaxID=139045 RepID=UPI00265B2D9A|nr:uncharacterized protein LOC131261323 [Anopheles coustani]XP_058173989.1 uncharacterized protein LOC131288828 [Anopheles ziemanni]
MMCRSDPMGRFSSTMVVSAVALLLIFIADHQGVAAIKCYQCTVAPPSRHQNNTKTQLCSKFDESDLYQVDCPWSTMCMKRIFKLQLLKGEQETVSRGCAQQKNTEQVYKSGAWTPEHNIEEPYEEGCQTLDDSTYCFCRGALCNSATKAAERGSYHTDAMAVIFVFNVMKYIRNIEH